MRYFISISYRGNGFCGWQIQTNERSIEEELEKALSALLKESIDVTGAGRTDTGVNAINYIAHFDVKDDKSLKEPERFIYKINAILPSEIVVHDIFSVEENAHARFDAISRTYKYYIHTVKDPFVEPFSYFCKFPLNIEAMNKAAQYLIGTKDFSSFEKLHGGNSTSICDLSYARWEPYTPNFSPAVESLNPTHIVFTITANRFLRNMVRAIVGSLIEVGRGRKEPEWIESLLLAKDRCKAGGSVVGKALFLTDIRYPYNLLSSHPEKSNL